MTQSLKWSQDGCSQITQGLGISTDDKVDQKAIGVSCFVRLPGFQMPDLKGA